MIMTRSRCYVHRYEENVVCRVNGDSCQRKNLKSNNLISSTFYAEDSCGVYLPDYSIARLPTLPGCPVT